ncbi:PRC-barrel domain-containing protein [Streptomyces sp. NBC_00638]|uniref:PRC-barrel domain-containing protein n=1 Tax=unclassified Streptomyces TaxID=2593676 RepID=UPI002250106B|nr:PRC-barrel domain-containing protein [Streptomyces sp. NBC_00638]MCX5008592.1 PRC-barrel domain-containing protein [Streptomyces sp. NBC_00638]
MITQGQIAAVLDHSVYDVDGNKIGDTRHVFLDDATGEPEWVSVKTGLFGTSESFVPTREAALVEDHLEVPYTKATVKDAPNVDVDAGGFLSVDEEHRLYEHYGIAWDEGLGWQQVVNQPDQGGQGPAASRTVTDATEGASLPYDNATSSGFARSGKGSPDTESARSDSSEDGVVMTRSEQEWAGTKSPAAGQARLRLYAAPQKRR